MGLVEMVLAEREERGIERGIERGMERGIERRNREVVINGHRAGYSIETISIITALTHEEIAKILESIN
jgi:predicted transposase YdaD